MRLTDTERESVQTMLSAALAVGGGSGPAVVNGSLSAFHGISSLQSAVASNGAVGLGQSDSRGEFNFSLWSYIPYKSNGYWEHSQLKYRCQCFYQNFL